MTDPTIWKHDPERTYLCVLQRQFRGRQLPDELAPILELYETIPKGLSERDLTPIPGTDRRVQEFIETASFKPRRIIELYAPSFSSFMRLVEQYAHSVPKPIFRGQSAPWSLTTTFERHYQWGSLDEGLAETREFKVLFEAKRRFPHHLRDLPKSSDTLGWLSLMRHHGVPKRLLDVTQSPFVAAFFAVGDCDQKTDGIIWIVDSDIHHLLHEWERNEALGPLIRDHPYGTAGVAGERWPMPEEQTTPRPAPTVEDLRHGDLPFFSADLVCRHALHGHIARPGVALQEPTWMPKRMEAQQGLFLIPFSIRHSFEENLHTFLGLQRPEPNNPRHAEVPIPEDGKALERLWAHWPLFRLRIPGKLKPTFKVHLDLMNIQPLGLFPDLDGVVQHLGGYLRAV